VHFGIAAAAGRSYSRSMTDAQATLAWVGGLVAAAAALIAFLYSRRTRVEFAELGTMSEQWLAEQRANDRPY
jgi:hypothetical protein